MVFAACATANDARCGAGRTIQRETTFGVVGGDIGFDGELQYFTAPNTTLYRIVAAGARGGGGDSLPGYGATIAGDVYLEAGTNVSVLVGKMGETGATGSGGGGGGSFVWRTLSSFNPALPFPEPLAVAGGGGGAAAPTKYLGYVTSGQYDEIRQGYVPADRSCRSASTGFGGIDQDLGYRQPIDRQKPAGGAGWKTGGYAFVDYLGVPGDPTRKFRYSAGGVAPLLGGQGGNGANTETNDAYGDVASGGYGGGGSDYRVSGGAGGGGYTGGRPSGSLPYHEPSAQGGSSVVCDGAGFRWGTSGSNPGAGVVRIIECKPPVDVGHGVTLTADGEEPGTLRYRCKGGYRIANPGTSSTHCQASECGIWKRTNLQCTGKCACVFTCVHTM